MISTAPPTPTHTKPYMSPLKKYMKPDSLSAESTLFGTPDHFELIDLGGSEVTAIVCSSNSQYWEPWGQCMKTGL